MIRNMQKMGFVMVLLTAGLLVGCGTSSGGPDGSMHQTATGVSETGYPGGQPVDAESPALGTSTEQAHSQAAPFPAKADEDKSNEGKSNEGKSNEGKSDAVAK
jgi:major membrane immunogen (membrane-anchored lipoprotein)